MATGLILSSSDFEILNAGGSHPPSRWDGGEYGSAVLNSSLESPLTSSGDFGRQFHTDSECFGGYYISSSVDSSLYSGSAITTSKAYSMRAWVRLRGPGNNSDHSAIGLSFMGQNNAMKTHGSDIRYYQLGGYCLQLSGMKPDGTVGDTLAPHLYIGTNEVSGTTDSSNYPATECSGGTYSEDEWHRIRFDMIPVGSAGVALSAYTSSAGDVESGQEIWEEVGSAFVQSTDDVYIPSLPTNGMGFYTWHDGGGVVGDTTYIDQFEILVQDL